MIGGEEGGRITVAQNTDDGPSLVEVQLTDKISYDLAVDAHKERREIQITGILVQKKNRFRLNSPRDVRLK